MNDQVQNISECGLAFHEAQVFAKTRKIVSKEMIPFHKKCPSWRRCDLDAWAKPISNFSNCLIGIGCVRSDVLTGDIRYKFLVSISFAVENQAVFLLLFAASKALRAKKQAKFQGHVEARKIVCIVKLRS